MKELAKSAGIVGGATLVSRVLGMVRDILSARIFGTGLVWDSFLIAFIVPNFLRRLFAEGALSQAFIPVFTEYLHKRNRAQLWQFANAALTIIALVVGGVVLVVVGGTEVFMRILPLSDKLYLALKLLKILFPYLLFISLAAVLMGMLNSFKAFLLPSSAPIILNLFWIGGLIWLSPVFGAALEDRIIGLCIGILLGGIAQIVIQISPLVKRGFRFKWQPVFSHPGVKRVALLMAPAAFGVGIMQFNVLVDMLLGFFLGDGAISSLYYGNRLMQFPLAIFGIAMNTAVLPTFSGYAVKGDIDKLKRALSFAVRSVAFMIIPAAAGLMVLSVPIIRLLFERGAFTSVSTKRVAFVLFFYSSGLFSYAALKIVVSAFHSFQDTKTPVKIGIIAAFANIIFNLILMWPLREGGLALATALSSTLNLALLSILLRRKIGSLGTKIIAKELLRTITASLVMAIGCWLILQRLSGASAFIQVLIPLLSGVGIFGIMGWIMGIGQIREMARRRK